MIKLSEKIQKIERISLRMFLSFMLLCALSLLVSIWFMHEAENFYKATATFFIIGLASFLVWLPIVVYRIIDIYKK